MLKNNISITVLSPLLLSCLAVAAASFGAETDYGSPVPSKNAATISCTQANTAVADYFDLISETKKHQPDLVEALRQFPKGADLHNHLSGAIMPEEYFALGKADGDCYGPDGATAYTIATAGPSGICTSGFKPLATAAKPDRLKILQSLSMYQYKYPDIQQGHDQFFATFGRFGVISGAPWNTGPMLSRMLKQANRDSVSYVETMFSFQSQAINTLTGLLRQKFSDDALYRDSANYPALYDYLLSIGLKDAVAGAQSDITQYVNRTNAILRCGLADKDPACSVSYAFLASVNRNAARNSSADLAKIFTQTAFSMLLASTDSRVVGVNLLSGEDAAISMQSFATQMQFFTYFHDKLPGANIALHAGELTPCFIGSGNPALKEHLTGSLKAGAKRIGHGVSFAYLNADERAEVAGLMKKNDAVAEIMFTSNAQILGVAGTEHPFNQYRSHGIPTVFSTDDEGVSHADYTSEWVYGFKRYGLKSSDLVRLGRESFQRSFIPGSALWSNLDEAKVVSQCSGITPGTPAPPEPCRSFLSNNAKAAAQWNYEARLARYLKGSGKKLEKFSGKLNR